MEDDVKLLELKLLGAGDRGYSYIKFDVYQDGKFMKEEGQKKEPAEVIETTDGKVIVYEHNSTKFTGTLSTEKFDILKAFLNENVKEDSSSMIFDCTYTIKYFMDGKEVVITNNEDLYNQITKLIPYDLERQRETV